MWKLPFISITACLATGILLGYYILSFYPTFLICCLIVMVSFVLSCFEKTHNCVPLIILIALILAGALRYHLAQNLFPPEHYIFVDPHQIRSITGKVEQVTHLPQNRSHCVVSVSEVCINDQRVKSAGKLLLQTKGIKSIIQHGDRVYLYSPVECLPGPRNPGQFDYRGYAARQNIFYRIVITSDSKIMVERDSSQISLKKILIEPLRGYCQRTFSKYIKTPANHLADALFLGEKQGLDKEMVTQFKKTGVVHILAISGLHVGFIIAFVLILASVLRLSSRWRLIVLILVLFMYVVLINFRPPVMRAALMAVLFMFGQQQQRIVQVYNIIPAAATVILLLEPRELFNPGFQFSFVAVLSIIAGYDGLKKRFPFLAGFTRIAGTSRVRRICNTWVCIPLLVSFSATLGTLALTWYYYGIIPLYAVFANLLVIPLTGLMVLLILFLLIAASFSPFLASGIAGIFLVIHNLLLRIVSLFFSIPGSAFESAIPPPWIAAGLLVLIFLFFFLHYKPIHRIFITFFFLLTMIILIPKPSSQNLRAAFLDVGQGDAAVLEFPSGKSLLIDAGDRNRFWDNGSETVVPYLKNRDIMRLTYVVLSHPHNDHLGGMQSVLEAIHVDTVVTSAYAYYSHTYESFLKTCDQRNIPLRFVQRGDQLFTGPECRVYVLHPDSVFSHQPAQDGSACNNASVVLKILYGKTSILFMGDAEKEAELSLNSYGEFLKSEILKIGHHGSITSTGADFLNQVQPLISLISVAEKNRFKHPSPFVLGRLQISVPKLYLTKQSGAVIFELIPDKVKKITSEDIGYCIFPRE